MKAISRKLLSGLSVLAIIALHPAIPAYAQAAKPAAAPAQTATAEAPAALLTDDQLEVLVARIALYPDELVAAISSASLFPLQIIEVANEPQTEQNVEAHPFRRRERRAIVHARDAVEDVGVVVARIEPVLGGGQQLVDRRAPGRTRPGTVEPYRGIGRVEARQDVDVPPEVRPA